MRPAQKVRVVVIILVAVFFFLSCFLTAWKAVEGATSQSEIKRRLGLAPFAYVAEIEYDFSNFQQTMFELHGKLAVIDSVTDLLVDHPEAGSSLQMVAVSPDGTRVYVTDANEPFLHVFDADTHQYLLAIELPGVEPRAMDHIIRYHPMSDEIFPYPLVFTSCAYGVACTPDGNSVMVCSSAGLQVIDTQTNQVTKTLEHIEGDSIAISFDGTRAYISICDLAELPPRSYAEWFELILNSDNYRLIMLDLQSWEIIGEIKTYAIGGIAVRPDEPEVYFSESYLKKVRVVDAMTLEDLWQYSTEPSFSIGIGFMPDGSKAYVVCSADIALPFLEQTTNYEYEMPKAEDYFCAVIDTELLQVIKKIPLNVY